jgi:hypothetical protein
MAGCGVQWVVLANTAMNFRVQYKAWTVWVTERLLVFLKRNVVETQNATVIERRAILNRIAGSITRQSVQDSDIRVGAAPTTIVSSVANTPYSSLTIL